MDTVILYNESDSCFILWDSDSDKTWSLYDGEFLTVFSSGEWIDTRVDKNSSDPLYGWSFVGLGPCARFVGHRAFITHSTFL